MRAIVRLQASRRRRLAKEELARRRIEAAIVAELHSAVTYMQRVGRGMLARKERRRLHRAKLKREADRRELERVSATYIQRVGRGMLARKERRWLYAEKLRRAAIHIQRCARGMFARTERRRQSAARHIQSVFRRSRAAKRCKLLVSERAAAVTQVAEASTTAIARCSEAKAADLACLEALGDTMDNAANCLSIEAEATKAYEEACKASVKKDVPVCKLLAAVAQKQATEAAEAAAATEADAQRTLETSKLAEVAHLAAAAARAEAARAALKAPKASPVGLSPAVVLY